MRKLNQYIFCKTCSLINMSCDSTRAPSHRRVQWAVFMTKPRPRRSYPNEPVSLFPPHKDTQASAAREEQDQGCIRLSRRSHRRHLPVIALWDQFVKYLNKYV